MVQIHGTILTGTSDSSGRLHLHNIDGSFFVSAVEVTRLIILKDRRDAYSLLQNALNATDTVRRATAAEILSKKAQIPGFDAPTWVLTMDQALRLPEILPAKYTHDIREYIRKTFMQVEAGSAEVAARVARNAQSNSPAAVFARDGLGEQQFVLEDMYTGLELEEVQLGKRRMLELRIGAEEEILKRSKLWTRREAAETEAKERMARADVDLKEFEVAEEKRFVKAQTDAKISAICVSQG